VPTDFWPPYWVARGPATSAAEQAANKMGWEQLRTRLSADLAESAASLSKEIDYPLSPTAPVDLGLDATARCIVSSSVLYPQPPDWRPITSTVGYPFHRPRDHEVSSDMAAFIADGPPPLLVSLGSAIDARLPTLIGALDRAARRVNVRLLVV